MKLRPAVTPLVLSLLACGGGTTPSEPPQAPSGAAGAKHWTYVGTEGPERWGDLDPTFALCKAGKTQTPIDLPSRPPADAKPAGPTFSYKPVPLDVSNLGHTIQVDGPGSSLSLNGTAYELAQFHFHSPSEHTVGGEHFAAELHFVHKNAAGKLLVVGLLFKKGAENAALASLWSKIPSGEGDKAKAEGSTLDIASLLPKSPRFLRYDGSLTTPPCSEGVTWLVVAPDAPLELSEAQIAKLQTATHGATNRPIQPLNGRAVTELK